MKLRFMSAKESDEKCLMHSKSDNKEISVAVVTNEIIEKLFRLILVQVLTGSGEADKDSQFCV